MTKNEITRALRQIEANRDAVDKAQRLTRQNSAAIVRSSKTASDAFHALRRSGAMKGAVHSRDGRIMARKTKTGRIVDAATKRPSSR